jgi:4-hydroxybenzoyl-CoA reductase subunit beta
VDTRCNYYNQTEFWRASIGYCMKKDGHICLVAPGSDVCWALSSSDTAPVMIALGAEVTLVGPQGERRVAVRDLYGPDGINYLAKRADEVLTQIHVPDRAGWTTTYRKLRRRGSIDFPIVGVAAAVRMGTGAVVEEARLVLGAVHTAPVEAADAQEFLGRHRLQGRAAARQRRSQLRLAQAHGPHRGLPRAARAGGPAHSHPVRYLSPAAPFRAGAA